MNKDSLIQVLVNEGYLKTRRIIDAFHAVDRVDFVLPEYRIEAYQNYPLPIGHGQTISQPLTVAFMLELLEPRPGEHILDIGCGSGWQTALLAQCVGEKGGVTGIERIPELCAYAKENVKKYQNLNIEIICGDATNVMPAETYDKIIAAAAASKEIPELWKTTLKTGGRIVAPVDGSIWLFVKKSETEWEEHEFPGFVFVPLVGSRRSEVKNQNSQNHLRSISTETLSKSNFNKKKYILGVLICSLLITGMGANEIYRPHTAYQGSKAIEIPDGFGSRKIGELLKKEGAIRSKWVFVMYVSLKQHASNLKPGNYVFGNIAIPEIVRDLVKGGSNEQVITIPEGWAIKEIAAYLKNNKVAPAEKFLDFTAVKHSMFDNFEFLEDKPKNLGLEGFLFPDTYRIFKDATVEDIIRKMLTNFDKKLTNELRDEIARQGKTIFEIVTMASLIEKEVVSESDRATISDILWKRLAIGMPLQVDATITYITGKRSTKISREETQIDSPYNTYKYPGLPKGPIGNPGVSAIRAALSPQKSPYLYYLSTPDGKTIFSETLEEHNEAKRRYLAL